MRLLGRGGSVSRMRRRTSSWAACSEFLRAERRGAGQQFVQQDAQRIDVAAGIHVDAAELRLFGAHVERRSDQRLKTGVHRAVGQVGPERFGDAKVDDFGNWLAVDFGDQDVASA